MSTCRQPFRRRLLAVTVAAGSLGAAVPASASEPPCRELTEPDRALVAHIPRNLVEGVTPLVEAPRANVPFVSEHATLAGATVAVHPAPGLTAERLQRVVECGLVAAQTPGASDWPALPAGVVASVRSGGDRFLVDLRAASASDAGATLAAAQQLAPRR